MPTLQNLKNRSGLKGACALIAVMTLFSAAQAAVSVGSTAPDFTIRNHSTGQPLRLYNYAGNIILLDFWAYWCGPCQSAAADMEPNIVQYYRTNGGNSYGVPVQVISISVDMSDPISANNFIQTYGLELVGDDTGGAYSTYGDGYIPYMVVINGTTNSTNYRAWQVLHSTSGYTRSTIKSAIDSVQTPPPVSLLTSPVEGALVSPPNVPLTAVVTNNGKIIKKVEFYDGSTLLGAKTAAPYSITCSNVSTGAKAVFARASYGAGFRADSAPVNFTVGNPTAITGSLSAQGTNLLLKWTGSPGLFRVQRAINLRAPVWEYVTLAATNTSFVIAPSNAAGFFRVVRP